jgi:Na+/H+-dicarboxylate symporter
LVSPCGIRYGHSEGSTASGNKSGRLWGLSLPIWVLLSLAAGLALGLVFPKSRIVSAIYATGTYFPKAVVTFAALLIFILLAGATSKLVLLHRRRAGRLFGLIVAIYAALALASLVFAALWIPPLTHLPFAAPGVAIPGPGAWLAQVGNTFSRLLSDQPLMQVLVSALLAGYCTAAIAPLRPVARGLIAASDAILWLFRKLLWYYPVMIGCLAIGIPTKCGAQGMTAYGRTILWVALITAVWSVILAVATKLSTRRTLKQMLSYYATVWPTGFGTGGSYDALAVNLVSAEQDLGLRNEIAEVSIVFGTVLNKSCAAMSVLLVTITTARLLHIPISMAEILMLVPPVLVLGLESPGIPGGAAFFMSPIVAVLLRVPNVEAFVTTFVTIYSGLIPMFTTAGNTTNDGLVGAVLNDRFANYLGLGDAQAAEASPPALPGAPPRGLRRSLGWALLAAGAWMLVSPQALLGLTWLKWMSRTAFTGEVLPGVVVLCAALYLLRAPLAVSEPSAEPSLLS